MNDTYIINAEGQIKQVNYKELVWQFVDMTTTPCGAAARLHVREEATRFEGWTWGHQGNFPKQIQVFDTQEEADEWLFKGAEMDFQNDFNAPMLFNTQAEAEEWVRDL